MKLNKRRSIILLTCVVIGGCVGRLIVRRLYGDLLNRYIPEEVTMRSRTEKLNLMCDRLGKHKYKFQDSQISGLRHIIVDEKYKVMFCYVPKVACSNFLRIFLSLSDNINVSNPLYFTGTDVHILKRTKLTTLAKYSNTEIEYRIKHYKKVIFVREPLERVFSAFRNKFILTQNTTFQNKFRRIIIHTIRNNPTNTSLDTDVITFTEFVKYLLHWKTITRGYNEHWDSFSSLCYPCLLRYNYIGKYESFEKDVAGFLKLLGIEGKVEFPKREQDYSHAKSADVMSTFFAELPQILFEYLLRIYTEDYVLFNYRMPLYEQIIKTNL